MQRACSLRWAYVAVSLCGCNALLGLDERMLSDGGDGATSSGAVATASEAAAGSDSGSTSALGSQSGSASSGSLTGAGGTTSGVGSLVVGSGSANTASTGAGAFSGTSGRDNGPDATMIDGRPFALTSPAFSGIVLAPDAGLASACPSGDGGAGTFPAANTCASPVGDISPELDWTAGPAGTKSYAIVLHDLCNNLFHWAVWDIPASAMQLPSMAADGGTALTMPAGAMQVSFRGTSYVGPCPGSGNVLHTYEFTLYALDVTALAGPTGSPSDIETLARMHSLATATLAGTSNAKNSR
jgi:Raf kinase inhibitor-like YbhB/YbcL family protein